MEPDTQIVACMVTLPAEPPEWVHLMKAGPLEASDGRKWRLDDPARVVAESLAAGRDLAIDYDHQTELVMKTGQAAPAAGWIKALEARDDGIWGRVEWKPTGAEKLKAREYRYLSPTFLARKGNGQVLRILRAALTNSPALTLTALASHQSQDHEDSMDELLKNLIATLGLKGDADAETALARVNALATEAADAKAHMARVAKAAGQAEDADADMLCTAIAGLAAGGDDADPAKFVARAQFDEVANLLRTLTDDRAEGKGRGRGRDRHERRQAGAGRPRLGTQLCQVRSGGLRHLRRGPAGDRQARRKVAGSRPRITVRGRPRRRRAGGVPGHGPRPGGLQETP